MKRIFQSYSKLIWQFGRPKSAPPTSEKPSQTKEFTKENFRKEVLEASMKKPVLVDLWAPWCAACVDLTPTIDELARKAGNKAIIGKYNVGKKGELLEKFKLGGIPAILIFRHGKLVNKFEPTDEENIDINEVKAAMRRHA